MGDRAPASFTLYRVVPHQDALADLFKSYAFLIAKDWSTPVASSIHDGVTLQSEESSLGILEEIGAELENLGVAYRGAQDAKYENDAQVRLYTKELGAALFVGTQEGNVVVSGTAVANIADRLFDLAESASSSPLDPADVSACAEALAALAGYAWYNEFARLDALVATGTPL